MTAFWKIIVLSISLLLCTTLSVKSQEILQTEAGDTLVTITPRQLNIINCIISDFELGRVKEEVLRKKIIALEERNLRTDSLLIISREEIAYKDEYWGYRVTDLEKTIKKEVRKKNIIGGVGGALVVTLLTLLLLR